MGAVCKLDTHINKASTKLIFYKIGKFAQHFEPLKLKQIF